MTSESNRFTTLRFVHETRPLPGIGTDDWLAICPIEQADAQLWLALSEAREVVRLDLDADSAQTVGTVPVKIPRFGMGDMRISRDGRFAAVFNPAGQYGAVVDLETSRQTMRLDRGTEELEHCAFPVAFFQHRGRTLLAHASEWNRLEVSDPSTGELLTERVAAINDQGRSEHDLDYFHGALLVSPGNWFIADDGWGWHPMGCPRTWSLSHWLGCVWESEDGPSARDLCYRDGFWGGPMCWIDDRRLAVWGQGDRADSLLDAVRIFDVETGRETHWFPGPARAPMVFDEFLFSLGQSGMSVWDADSGELLLHDPEMGAGRLFHPGTRTFVQRGYDGDATISRLVGHPSIPLSRDARLIAEAIAAGRDWAALPVLADALEDDGFDGARILSHLREGGPHGHSCWAVRRLLGT